MTQSGDQDRTERVTDVTRRDGEPTKQNADDLSLSAEPPSGGSVDPDVTQDIGIEAQSGAVVSFRGGMNPVDVGSTFGRYEILEQIDNGGMGVIYKARHTALGKTVALKLMSTRVQAAPLGVERFEREMQAIGRLDPHPNVLNAYDAGSEQGIQFIATELIEGVQLGELVQRVGALSVSECCRIIAQAALGIRHLASHDLVHRDIKPSNLMLTRDGVVKVVDLGLALLRDEQTDQLTISGETMGSIDYMAPEQWDDSHSVDFRSDIYGLGCTFFCLLAGYAPFSNQPSGSASRMRAHIMSPFPDITSVRGDVPAEAVKLLNQMVVKDPNRRLSDLGLLAEKLDVIAAGDLKGLVDRCFSTNPQKNPRYAPPKPRGERESAFFEASTGVLDHVGEVHVGSRLSKVPKAIQISLCALAAVCVLGVVAAVAIPRDRGNTDETSQALPDSESNALGLRGNGAELNPNELSKQATVSTSPSEVALSLTSPVASFGGHSNKVVEVFFLKGDKRLASISHIGEVLIFDVENPVEPLHRVKVGNRADFGMEYNPEIETLAVVSRGVLEFRSTEDLSLVREGNFEDGLSSVSWVPGGTSFVTSDWQGAVREFEVSDTGLSDKVIASRPQAVFDVDVSPDGSFMAFGGLDPGLVLFDRINKTETNLQGFTQWLYEVAISSDGKMIAAAGHEGIVLVWKMPEREVIAQFEHLVPTTVKFTSDRRFLVVGGRTSIVNVWDIAANKIVQRLSAPSSIASLAISSDSKLIAAGTENGTIQLWEADFPDP